jgi:hypothetical protein
MEGPVPDRPHLRLNCFVRVVELPLDPFGVHLVVEVSRPGVPRDAPDFRAETTVCRQVGYRGTLRTENACEECQRGYGEACMAARMATRVLLGLGAAR